MINIIITIETDCMTKSGHVIKAEVIMGTIRTIEIGVTIEIIGIGINTVEVIEGNNNNRNRLHDKIRSYDKSRSYNGSNKNHRDRSDYRDNRNRDKYSRGNRRKLKVTDREYDFRYKQG